MEGAMKLPSFKCPSLNPNAISMSRATVGHRSFSRVRRSFSVSACTAADSESVSLGHRVRKDFRILHQEVYGKKLVYLDSAATSQKPAAVVDALCNYYECFNSNVHRATHYLSRKATKEYELAREKVARFINASDSTEIVFTKNATEAINLVAVHGVFQTLNQETRSALGLSYWIFLNFILAIASEMRLWLFQVLVTVAEHHSNIVPWQRVTQKTGAVLKYVELNDDEVPDIDQMREMISPKTKLVAVHHVSNVLASCLPIEDIVVWAHNVRAKVLVDACQSVPHMVVDVQKLNADFLVASSHKMCGPTGVGFLYGKKDLLFSMPPFLGGGSMITDVFPDHSTYAEPPYRFEAGTPPIGAAIALGAAVDYLTGIGMEKIHEYELELGNYLYEKLSSLPHVRIYGPRPSANVDKAPLCSFNVEGLSPNDLSFYLDREHGVAIRTGRHCAIRLHSDLGVNESARASLYLYNTKEEVDFFIFALEDAVKWLNFHK